MGFYRVSLSLIICIIGVVAMLEPCSGQDSPQDYLDVHNWARAEVGVRPMEWDETVAAYAQEYANQRSGDCSLFHSGGNYGENLAWGSGDLSAADAVWMWVEEKSIYDYDSNTCLGENPWDCLHYTQVVWRDSTRLGCAKVWCDVGGTFIICSYDPPGNFNGQRPFANLAKAI
ncbi:pathogenesis-related protein 1-like [Humulus lupulus]|uniref:pathogenesis-related protein 1-like n=1 Tax=Humulus lupulus TaxID=3486 RepID=UPI002B40F9A7|nr:pathogenesis-related protein 1-like [Humulus lupulus]